MPDTVAPLLGPTLERLLTFSTHSPVPVRAVRLLRIRNRGVDLYLGSVAMACLFPALEEIIIERNEGRVKEAVESESQRWAAKLALRLSWRDGPSLPFPWRICSFTFDYRENLEAF